jgi:hypothetical protein
MRRCSFEASVPTWWGCQWTTKGWPWTQFRRLPVSSTSRLLTSFRSGRRCRSNGGQRFSHGPSDAAPLSSKTITTVNSVSRAGRSIRFKAWIVHCASRASCGEAWRQRARACRLLLRNAGTNRTDHRLWCDPGLANRRRHETTGGKFRPPHQSLSGERSASLATRRGAASAVPTRESFVPEGQRRIDPRCSARGNVSRKEGDGREQQQHRHERGSIRRGDAVQEP